MCDGCAGEVMGERPASAGGSVVGKFGKRIGEMNGLYRRRSADSKIGTEGNIRPV